VEHIDILCSLWKTWHVSCLPKGYNNPQIIITNKTNQIKHMYTNPCLLLVRNSIIRLRLASVAAVLAIGLLLAASSARALTFDFNSDHCTGLCGPGPFGTVTLTANAAGGVDITVHLDSPFFFVKTGSADNQAFKFNAVDVALGDITVDPHIPGLVAAFSAQPNGFNGDGTGEFQFGINCPTCGGGASDKFNNDIKFTVADATIADLTQPNNLGIIFVADVINTTKLVDGQNPTGPIDVSGPPRTPDSGSTALLLGLGLFGLGFARLPVRKKA